MPTRRAGQAQRRKGDDVDAGARELRSQCDALIEDAVAAVQGWVADVLPAGPFASLLVVKKLAAKTASNGNAFFSIELGDRTGSGDVR